MATCLYRHIRLDNNEVFYVGIGSEKRPYKKHSRSSFWKNIVGKSDYDIEVLAKNLSWEDACELEVFMISEYGRRDLGLGNLVNLTDGGEGMCNLGPKTIEKMKASMKGRVAWNKGKKQSEEQKLKQSLAAMGRVSSRKGVKLKESTKEKIRVANIGKKQSEETKNKISKATCGSKNPAAIKIIDTSNNKIYGTMKEAAKDFNIKYTTLSAMLNGYCKNKTNLKKHKL
tara:strand:+ start:40 stop:723 length:684 start_codon:yes stop_codon:yes gene_type:complete